MNRFENILEKMKKRENLEMVSPLEAHVLKWMTLCHLFPKQEHRMGGYLIDFAFMEDWIAVEVDGKKFHDKKKQKKKDAEKDAYLKGQGWQVFRIPSEECWNPKKLAVHLDKIWAEVGRGRQRPFMLCELLDSELEIQRSKNPNEGWCIDHGCFLVDCDCFDGQLDED